MHVCSLIILFEFVADLTCRSLDFPCIRLSELNLNENATNSKYAGLLLPQGRQLLEENSLSICLLIGKAYPVYPRQSNPRRSKLERCTRAYEGCEKPVLLTMHKYFVVIGCTNNVPAPSLVPTRLKQTHKKVDCCAHSHLQSNNFD